MRNFKKFLALLLATMMVLGGMVTVSAAEEVAETTAEEVAIDYEAIYEQSAAVLNKLDILKGNGVDFDLDAEVLRYQKALFIARIVTGETSDSHWSLLQDNTTTFEDVTEYYGAISLMAEMNIIKGVGNNKFNPCGKITYAHALTMANRAYGEHQWKTDEANIKAAESYGLTAGLEPLEANDELTRGQVVQILYNLLFAVQKDGKTWAEKSFDLKNEAYAIVATNDQFINGTGRVDNPGYVELAKVQEDGTFDYDDCYYFTEAELGLEAGDADLMMGYSFTISTVNNYADIVAITLNDVEIFENYGDEKNEIAAGSKYNNITNKGAVKINGVNYQMVEYYTATNKGNTGRYPELIVRSMYEEDKNVASTYYIYDGAGNILDDSGRKAIICNYFTNTYYAAVAWDDAGEPTQYKLATEDDFKKYAHQITGVNTYNQYGLLTDATDMANILFSQIAMIDDNGDGQYDRAIYTPYSVGKMTEHSEKNAWQIASSKDSGSTKKTTIKINGTFVGAYATNTSGVYDYRTKVQKSDINFIGERPAKNEYIVYYYNPYTLDLVVVENLGGVKKAPVISMTQGTYKYTSVSNTFYYDGATVTLNTGDAAETYVLGYRNNVTWGQFTNKASDLDAVDANLALYGYDQDIYTALLNQTYRQLEYVILAGRMIYAAQAGAGFKSWMVFDLGDTKNTNITTGIDGLKNLINAEYTGDIIGLSDDNYIQIAAYVDDSGEKQVVKVGTINGYDYGALIMTYTGLTSGLDALGSVPGFDKYLKLDEFEQAVAYSFFKSLTKDLGTQEQYTYLVTGVSEDGIYDIDTNINVYWDVENSAYKYMQPSSWNVAQVVNFNYGIADAKNDDLNDEKVITMNDDTLVVIAGSDAVKTATGIQKKTTLTLTEDEYVYSYNNDFILVASSKNTCDTIYKCTWDKAETKSEYTYYMVLGANTDSDKDFQKNTICTTNWVNGELVYTYSNIYNITEGKLDTITVVGGLKEYNSAIGYYGANQPKPIGAIYSQKNGGSKTADFTLVTTDLVTVNTSNVAGKFQFAKDSKAKLEVILKDLFESKDGLGKNTVSANYIIFDTAANNKYDQDVTFAYDVVLYDKAIVEVSDDVYTGTVAVSMSNDVKSTTEKTGDYKNADATLYYTYDEGDSFVGTAILNKIKITSDAPSDESVALAAAKTAAIEALTAAAGNYLTGSATETALKAGVAAVTAAADTDAVKAAKEAALTAIKAAVEAAGAAEVKDITAHGFTVTGELKAATALNIYKMTELGWTAIDGIPTLADGVSFEYTLSGVKMTVYVDVEDGAWSFYFVDGLGVERDANIFVEGVEYALNFTHAGGTDTYTFVG